MIVVSSPRFAEHQTPPGHPESPERADVMDAIATGWRSRGGTILAPRAATDEELLRVHSSAYLAQFERTRGTPVALDPDTYTSPETYEIARLAAGGTVAAVEHVMNGKDPRAVAMVRPPGHHAERDRAMGFCFYNNVAVAAAHAKTLGAKRVAIVDYDVHHGNGTQHSFQSDPSVLYVSTHQYPYYPGTGAATEVGEGEGRGFTVNVPIEVGATDQDYQLAFDEIVIPVLDQFAPDLLLVSAGFDAHERDPLGGMRLTTGAFAAMTTALRRTADRHAGGRLMAVTEGGYDFRALHDSLTTVLETLAAAEAQPADWPRSSVQSARGAAAVRASRAALAPFWSL